MKAAGGHFALGDDLHAFFGDHIQAADLTFPSHARQNVSVVFEIKIKMPRPRLEHTAHLAAHPHIAQLAFDQPLHARCDLADAEFWHIAPRRVVVDQIHGASLALVAQQP